MEPSFWYNLALSYCVGSVWVTLSTVASERFGSKIGGFIGGLPSTAVVTLLFIGLTQSPSVASEATTIMPVAMGLNGIFLIVYLYSVRWGFATGLVSALTIWFVQAGFLASRCEGSYGKRDDKYCPIRYCGQIFIFMVRACLRNRNRSHFFFQYRLRDVPFHEGKTIVIEQGDLIMKNFPVLLVSLVILSTPCLQASFSDADGISRAEQEIWDLENAYITRLKEADVQGLAVFWHEKFIGWPSHNVLPVSGDQGKASLEELFNSMKIVSLTIHPKAIRIIGDVAVVHYIVDFETESTQGMKQKNSYRITHTWLKEKDTWKILGGMSSE